MRICALLLLCCALKAQFTPSPDPNFFVGDPQTIMVNAADKARAQEPYNSQLLARWGQVYLAAGARSRAEDAFRRALAADASDPGTHALIAMAWAQQDAQKEALAAFQAMPKSSSSAATWLGRVACRFLEHGMEAESVQAMEAAHRLAPKNWQMCVEFGRSAVTAKRLELAGTWFFKAVQIRPRDKELWTRIAQAYAGEPRE